MHICTLVTSVNEVTVLEMPHSVVSFCGRGICQNCFRFQVFVSSATTTRGFRTLRKMEIYITWDRIVGSRNSVHWFLLGWFVNSLLGIRPWRLINKKIPAQADASETHPFGCFLSEELFYLSQQRGREILTSGFGRKPNMSEISSALFFMVFLKVSGSGVSAATPSAKYV